MKIGICSYSFHNLLDSGKQDMFQFITDCKQLGCTQLDPWMKHLAPIRQNDLAITPANLSDRLTNDELAYIDRVKSAAATAGLPFGNIPVDGAHIYEPTPEARSVNRARAYRWLQVASILKAPQIRIDTGGPEELSDDIFAIIKDGYRDIIDRGRDVGIEIVVENHWGGCKPMKNIIRLLESIEGLGFLYDSYNWKPEEKAEARTRCAKYATAVHIKTLEWDDKGNEIHDDVPTAIKHLLDAGYSGAWGIESTPIDKDEMNSARKSVALLRRLVEQ